MSGQMIAAAFFCVACFAALPASTRAANPSTAPAYRPWGAPVAGFVEPAAGEHPRLLFRKADIPTLRARAQTPQGQKMVARLRTLLYNNGDELPKFDNILPLNGTMERTRKGHFTIGHPAGYGMLYILTGEKKYADLARTYLEKMFDDKLYAATMLDVKRAAGADWAEPGVEANLKKLDLFGKTDEQLAAIPFTYGQGDMDPRLNFTRPGTGMRPGPLLLCVALAYDLCYDAWPEDFRARVAKEIFEYKKPETFFQRYTRAKDIDLEQLVEGDNYIVRSNHYGYALGGAGVALLAVRNDPGIDKARTDRLLKRVETNLARLLEDGHGDRGYYAEGFGCGEISSNPTLLTFLQAARVSWGKDFVTPSEAAQWLSLKWLMCVIPSDKGDPDYHHVGGPPAYTRNRLLATHFSQSGEFAHGFGALTDPKQRAALLWTYNQAFARADLADTFNVEWYPHRMISVFTNWPCDDVKPLNPGEVIPKAVVDSQHGYYQFRNRWQDADDCFTAFLLNQNLRHGYIKGSPRGGVLYVFGHGLKYYAANWPSGSKPDGFSSETDGSSVLTIRHAAGSTSALLVDYSQQSGASAVIVLARAWPAENADAKTVWFTRATQDAKKGDAALMRYWLGDFAGGSLVIVIGKGELPKPQFSGDTLTVGKQTYTWRDNTLVFANSAKKR